MASISCCLGSIWGLAKGQWEWRWYRCASRAMWLLAKLTCLTLKFFLADKNRLRWFIEQELMHSDAHRQCSAVLVDHSNPITELMVADPAPFCPSCQAWCRAWCCPRKPMFDTSFLALFTIDKQVTWANLGAQINVKGLIKRFLSLACNIFKFWLILVEWDFDSTHATRVGKSKMLWLPY